MSLTRSGKVLSGFRAARLWLFLGIVSLLCAALVGHLHLSGHLPTPMHWTLSLVLMAFGYYVFGKIYTAYVDGTNAVNSSDAQ